MSFEMLPYPESRLCLSPEFFLYWVSLWFWKLIAVMFFLSAPGYYLYALLFFLFCLEAKTEVRFLSLSRLFVAIVLSTVDY